MIMEVDTVKGFKDYLPPESLKKEAVKKIIEQQFQLHGFIPIETPIIEFDELMKPDILASEEEDSAVSERFKLKDRAGRNLGLRYEFTFQLARLLKQNPNIKLPFLRYQIGPVFRDEPIGASRFRQFIQCDADIIGDASFDADTECLSLTKDILQALKIKNQIIEINNRKLLQSIIESTEITSIKEVMRELDKIDKLGEDIVKANLRKYADGNQVLTLFKLLEKDISFFKENAFDGATDLIELQKKCKNYGIPVKINPLLVRGFSYYTGTIFEIGEPGKPAISAGGRYDKLVGKYLNREIPAVGTSFGLERMSELANISPEPIPIVLLISLNQPLEAIKLAKKLRKDNISCLLSHDKVNKALEYANSYTIPWVIFLGEQEIQKGKLKLRNMSSGEESFLMENQLLKKLSSYQKNDVLPRPKGRGL